MKKKISKWTTFSNCFQLQKTGSAEITVCMKSLRNSISRPEIIVGVIVIAGKYSFFSYYKHYNKYVPLNFFLIPV